MESVLDWIPYLVGVAGILGISVTARVYLKFKGLQSSLNVVEQAITTITTTAYGLEEALKFERDERARESRECEIKLANLQGRIDVLTSGFVDKLIEAVKDRNRAEGG